MNSAGNAVLTRKAGSFTSPNKQPGGKVEVLPRPDVTIIVSTGRCGSTMVSRMLSMHPDVLSMSEFFASVRGALPGQKVEKDLDGQRLWETLSAPDPMIDALVRDGLRAPEMLYPYGSGRFNLEQGVPRISHFTLPLLANDPDALYDHLAAEVPTWPVRPTHLQYQALFAFLADLLGRSVVVERSGGSVGVIPQLSDSFPDARFIHMYRDGPDCALSMSRHPFFRIGELGRAAAHAAGLPWPSSPREVIASAPAEFRNLLAPPFDRKRFMDYPIPVTWFGERWSMSVRDGVTALQELPPERCFSLKYEDLLADPPAETIRLCDFLKVSVDTEWLSSATKLIDTNRTGIARAKLDEETYKSLQEACAPGAEALAATMNLSRE